VLDSIYIGLTGLTGYSKGLNNISNNVANLNTPGFKSSQMQFNDLFYRYQGSPGGGGGSAYAQGSGVTVGNTTVVFQQGELRATGNDQDVAIDGNGLFVLRQDGQLSYTRVGQFAFDADGYLVSRGSQARVAGLSDGNALVDINISGQRSSPAKPTATVKLTDSLSSNDNTFDLTNVNVFDGQGKSHPLTLHFINNKKVTPGSWLVEVREGTKIVGSGELRYQGNGTPAAGFGSLAFTYAPTNGAADVPVTLDFSGTNNFSSAQSSIKVDSQDGRPAGSLTKAVFNADGFLLLTYSNGQTVKNDRLALATFTDMQALQREGGNMLVNASGQHVQLGGAGGAAFGKVKGGSIELSNVDLAQQFSELIITQRGYQASSQIITAANEMIQQLFDLRSKR
jgi:flagellar hook protein FlgE